MTFIGNSWNKDLEAQDEREFADWFKVWALKPGPDSMRAIAEAAWNASRAALDDLVRTSEELGLYNEPPVVSAEARDAARYRFLRHADLDFMAAKYWPGRDVPEGDEFDAAIDAAMGTPPADKRCRNCDGKHPCCEFDKPADNKENGNG